MKLTLEDLMEMSEDLLDITLTGWERTIYYDGTKLAEECGEVAECLAKATKTDKDLGEELSDVIAVCCIIALKKNINLNQAIIDKQIKRITKLLNKHHNGLYPEGFSPRIKI